VASLPRLLLQNQMEERVQLVAAASQALLLF
jgi:hypothetical protein